MAQRSDSRLTRQCRRASLALGCLLASALARADIEVEVRGVDDQLAKNVLAYLSFQRYKDTSDLDDETIERMHNQVEREAQAALRPFGYYDPEVRSEVTSPSHGNWHVTVDIKAGLPVLLDAVSVEVKGPGANDPLFQRIIRNAPLHRGDRLQHALYEEVKSDLQRTAATYGYLDARFTGNRGELNVDPQARKARIILTMESGERYRFGATTIEQNAVGDPLVRRYLRYSQGDPFDLTQVLRTQFALDDSQYFANLEVRPGEPDRENYVVPITIHADPSRRNRYSIAGGYATDTGPRGTLGWQDRRINSLGHRFSVQFEASRVERYNLQSRYVIPIGDPAVENLAFQSTIQQLQLADVTAITQSIGPAITKVAGDWQYIWFANAMRTTSTSAAGTEKDRLVVPGIDLATVPKGYLGEPIFQHPFFLEIRGSDSMFGSDSDFLQVHAQAEQVLNLGGGWHLLLRDELGVTFVSGFSKLPAVMRFFAGGSNSVRGFPYDSLSPVTDVCTNDQNGNPLLTSTGGCQVVAHAVRVGGKDLITGTVEVIRDLPHDLGLATFFDYGNAFNHFGTPLQYSVGIGLRVRLPVVTLGIDIGQPLSISGRPQLDFNFSPKL
jgi:translocation and assembly module TamA